MSLQPVDLLDDGADETDTGFEPLTVWPATTNPEDIERQM
jgi:hypothetical protein